MILRSYVGCLLVVAWLISMFLAGCNNSQPPERIDIAKALSSVSDQKCYQAADRPAIISLPQDSGPHDAFQTEWWYYTGNLKTKDNHRFGFQLTFFRQALSCEPVGKGSKWRTRQLYFAHLGLTDVNQGSFYSKQRMNRESLGISGGRAVPFKIWIDDWKVEEMEGIVKLSASDDAISLDFSLSDFSLPIFQGNQGWSRKGPGLSNSSYYYSIPRIKTRGTITIGTQRFEVEGLTWFDHEWSTNALSTDVAGWDWFSVHLNDGRDLMVCQIRNENGDANGFGFGSISYPDGRREILEEQDFKITSSRIWKSPITGKRYPDKWRITVPGKDIDLMVTPLISNQEHTHSFAYWEGAARFQGDEVQGLGYVELTGY